MGRPRRAVADSDEDEFVADVQSSQSASQRLDSTRSPSPIDSGDDEGSSSRTSAGEPEQLFAVQNWKNSSANVSARRLKAPSSFVSHRQTSPIVEVQLVRIGSSSQASPSMKRSSQITSLEDTPLSKKAKLDLKKTPVRAAGPRQSRLSMFFGKPSSTTKNDADSSNKKEESDNYEEEEVEEESEEDMFVDDDEIGGRKKKSSETKVATTKKGAWEPKFRLGKPIKRIKDVPTLEEALSIEREARSRELRGDYPPVSDLSDIFADIVRRTPGIARLAKTLEKRPLRVATMCSGTESPLLALNLISRAIKEQHGIQIQIEHVFSCEIEPYKQAYIERNFAPPILFRDVCELGDEQAHTAYGALVNVPGNVDLLVAGTSCVDYSNLNNKRKGMEDGGESGRTFFGMLNWVEKHQPAIVLLENVKSAPWAGVGEAFADIKYDAAFSNTFDTKNYYIPHTRQRGYLIATQNREDSYAGNWEALTRSLARPASSSLEDFLLAPDDPRIQKVRTQFALGEGLGKGRSTIDWSKCQQRHERARDEECLGKKRPFTAWEEGGTCHLSHDAWNEWALPQPERVLDLLDITIMRAAKEGIDPHYKSRVWELSQNVDRNIASSRPGICMCLTPSGMPYLTSRGGPMVGLEALSLQGLPIDELLLTRETNDQLQNLAGNAMSSTVVGTCVLAALVIAQPDLEARRKDSDESIQENASRAQVGREIILTRDGKVGTKVDGQLTQTIYDITSCDRVSVAALIEKAVTSSQRCVCEGRRGTTTEIVHRCIACHHTACATCKGRPEHVYVVDQRPRGDPSIFAKTLKKALPMRLWIQCSDLEDLRNLSKKVPSSDPSLLRAWVARAWQVLSEGVEMRFTELLRQRLWLASYCGHGARLELLLDSDRPHWRLFIEPDSGEIMGSALRKLLRQPVARLPIDLSRDDALLLDGQWEICLPAASTFAAKIRHHGDKVPTWQAKMGIEGRFTGSKRFSRMTVEASSLNDVNLEMDISGTYVLLADCGTANGSLFARQQPSESSRLYFFLDPDRFQGSDSDTFVFATDISKLPHPLERVVIARAPGGWKPAEPKIKSEADHLNETIEFDVGGYWQTWSTLQLSTPSHFSANLALADQTTFTLTPCDHAATIVSISSSIFGSARQLWPKSEGEWYQVDLEHHAATVFRSLAWLTERLQLPHKLSAWTDIPDIPDQEHCQRCAPTPPTIQWLHTKGRPPVPVENEQQAGPYEQALKRRPAPFIVQLKVHESVGHVRIGINALTLAHRAMARLPPNEAVQGNVKLQWQMSHANPTYNLFNMPKYILSSNRTDTEAADPSIFKIPLRKEQKRSLHWMLAQESKAVEPFFEEEVAEGSLPPLGWRVEGKAMRKVLVRGGVLADAVGYGKTAITLGLIASTMKAEKEEAKVAAADNRFISTKATLVIVPPHLCKQWETEVSKFCGKRLSVVVIYSKGNLNAMTIEDIQDADIVIMSVSVYKSDAYFESLARLAAANPLPAKAGRFFDASLQCSLLGLRNRMQELQEEGAEKVQESVRGKVDFDESQFTTKKTSKRLIGQAYLEAHARETGDDSSNSTNKEVDQVAPADALLALRRSEAKAGDIWGLKTKSVRNNWRKMQALPMEAFHWRRVVIDEFHYVAETADRAFAAIKELQAHSTWILSGTPPTADFADVQSIAAFLRIHLGVPDDEDSTKSSVRSRKDKSRTQAEQFRNFVEIRTPDWHHRRQALGQRFLDRFVRQNVAEIDEIPMQVIVKPIRMPAAERACYLELAHMIEALDLRHARRLFRTSQKATAATKDKKRKVGEADSGNDRDERLQKTLGESSSPDEALSRQASHFILSEEEGNRLSNAIEACEFIVAERKEQRDDCLQQLERDIQATMKQHFVVLLQRHFRDEANQALVTFAKNVENGAWGDEDCKPKLLQLLQQLGCVKAGLSREKGKKLYPSWKQKKEDKEADWLEEHKLRDMVHMLQRLRNEYWSRVRSLRYFQTVRDIQRARSRVDTLKIQCPSPKCTKVGKTLSLAEISIASTCGHAGCNECLLREAYIGKCCTTHCHALAKPASIVLASTLGHERDQTTAYGIKLATVATIIKKVIPKEERILLFVQYDGLLKKVSDALDEYGVRFVRLRGSASSRSTQLSEFQEGSQRVLLLNIADESAAGSNLTVANHVIFLSPLISEEEQSYHATMEQAKGRAVRFGQTKEVKIWRFFVRDTIDQAVYERREGGLLVEEIGQEEDPLELIDVHKRK